MMNMSDSAKIRELLETGLSSTEIDRLIEADLNLEELEVLYNSDVDIAALRKVLANKIHSYMIHGDALTDGEYLIFTDKYGYPSLRDGQYKFLYYIGAENEFEIVAKWKTVTIFKVDRSRLSRYQDSETLLGEPIEANNEYYDDDDDSL